MVAGAVVAAAAAAVAAAAAEARSQRHAAAVVARQGCGGGEEGPPRRELRVTTARSSPGERCRFNRAAAARGAWVSLPRSHDEALPQRRDAGSFVVCAR